MTGQLFINGKDAWLTWGAFLVGDSLDNLLLPPPPKAYTENNFRSQDGKQVFIVNTKKDARDVQVEFCIKAESRADHLLAYKSFVEELSGGVVDMSIPSISMDFKLTVASYLSLGYYDHFGKLSVRFNEPYSVPVVIKDYIEISGRVEDVISKEGVSSASVITSFGDYQIAKTSTNQAGEFSYLWRISESEYNNLVAGKGSVLRWIAQKDGYTTKESQTNIPTDYRDAVRQGISTTIQLLAKGNTTASDIPIGFNMRGMTIRFLNQNLMPQDYDYFAMSFAGIFGALEQDNSPIQSTINRTFTQIFDGTRWRLSEYTFPDDNDYIVTSNNLPAGTPGVWGWDSAIVTGTPYPLTADKVPAGFNLRNKTVVFTNIDKPMTDGQMFADEISLWCRYPTSTNTLLIMTSTFDGGAGGEWEIYISGYGLSGTFNPVFWNINTGWRQTSFTFPDDQDYIVYYNELRPAVGDSWGWNYAIIKD